MIEFISGRLIEKNPAYAVIDCNGVGYYLNISLHTFSQLPADEACKLYAHVAIREDAHTLYGFADQFERQLFRLLISVSGVGASTARVILSSLNPIEVQEAIANADVNLLKSIKGIGAKSAQRIIVDLKDKIAKAENEVDISFQSSNTTKDEALSALDVLGFNKNAAEKVIDKLLRSGDSFSVEELVKNALKNL